MRNRTQYHTSGLTPFNTQQIYNAPLQQQNINSSPHVTHEHKLTDKLLQSLENINKKLDCMTLQQNSMYSSKQTFTAPFPQNPQLPLFSPYRPRPAQQTQNLHNQYSTSPLHSAAGRSQFQNNRFTFHTSLFCWYHTTFGPRAVKCSPGCTFMQQFHSQSLNYQAGATSKAPQLPQ